MQATFVCTMQQGQHQHLRLVFWNGADCAMQDLSALVGPHMKELAQKEHTGEFHWFPCFALSLVIFNVEFYVVSNHVTYSIILRFKGNIVIKNIKIERT